MKLNDVFEFIGVFTFDPELAVHKDDSDEFSNGICDDALVHLPPSKVVTLFQTSCCTGIFSKFFFLKGNNNLY